MKSDGANKVKIDDALTRFSQADGSNLIEASGVLIGANALVTYARDARMKAGLDRLVNEIERARPTDRLPYLARLWHLTAQAPLNKLRPDIARRLKPLPPVSERFGELRDPNDRRYAAEALADVAGDWLIDYASRAIVEEEAGERARMSLATALFARADNLNICLRLVSQALTNLEIVSQDRGTSRARRLVRVLGALSAAVVAADLIVEEGVGADIAAILDAGLGRVPIGEPEAAEELAVAMFAFIRMLVRFHGTLAADADTFAAAGRLRALFFGTDWPERVVPEAEALARTVREALIFLARQDIADERLRQVHRLLVGDVASGVLLRQAVGEGRGLSGSVSTWLVTGRMPKALGTQAATEASVLEAIDGELARAFRESAEMQAQLAVTEEELMDAARDVSPVLGEQVGALLRRVRRTIRHIDSAASKRGFALRGRAGDVVEFSVNEHEMTDAQPASRTVRLRNRIVERARGKNSVDVVVRAEVDRL